ncbi:MAG: c-type cytochrome [Verrucomicrobiales bacterium]|nr:c-type cytochrome [Verrucomicrobiales bacterium]
MIRLLRLVPCLAVSMAALGVGNRETGSPAGDYRPERKSLGFPVYTNQPPGRQLAGQHAPAETPALSPEEARKRFTVPEGFEIRLFASEPEVVNPVAMTWDERGRLWVVELYEYPLGAKPGEAPRDRIKILEDTDGDGRADKVHVWADQLNLATGLLLGRGGAYVGQAPHLLFLKDTDGDDRADSREILKTGFGLEDRHELLNGFTWGPDGQFYMTHGVFTRSMVREGRQGAADAEPVLLTAGVARMDPATGKFEVYAEGTSNPWGVDFDRWGNAFVSACVIEHLFHLVPGGLYDRQAGAPPHPFAYEELHAINDHKHHMAAYAGIQVYQGNQFPADNAGTILQGNIHDNAVHQDVLKPNGSSFVASKWRDLVRANDGWFMPVSTQIGPDGAVWIMDWYDRYPCYQNANADPSGVDREHGRIWRVVYTGTEKGKPVPSRPERDMNLAKLDGAALVDLLGHPNVWQRRTAQRLLIERHEAQVAGRLQTVAREGVGPESSRLDARLAALWTLHASGSLSDQVLAGAATDREWALRAAAARIIGERQTGTPGELAVLEQLADDAEPQVRLAVAVACRQLNSGQLTVNRPPRTQGVRVDPILARLVGRSADAKDPVIPFMIWHAVEPMFAAQPVPILGWFLDNGANLRPLMDTLVNKAVRRLCDRGGADSVDLAVLFIDRLLPKSEELAMAALDGLIKGQEGKALTPSTPSGPFIAKLTGSGRPELVVRGEKLGTYWGDAAALKAVLARAQNSELPVSDRVRAIQTVRQNKTDATRAALVPLLDAGQPEPVQTEAIAALGEIGGDNISTELLTRWRGMSPAARRVAAATLASRRRWAMPLLAEVKQGKVSASDFGAPVIRSLMQNKDEAVREEAKAAIGRFRETTGDKVKLIAQKRAMVLEGQPDFAAGKEVATRACLVCHKLHGEGAEVGPDLTGVGRSSLDALLANVIDPNQVVGAGYPQVEIETRDDRVVAGRVVEQTDTRVRLLMQGPKEEVIAKSDIKSQRTLESSVMPEGLEQMPDADFRNLIWYILAPPQEGPLTPQKRESLIGGGHASPGSAAVSPSAATGDRESVALWNPEWRVVAPDFEGTPAKLADYHQRSNVLMTHPYEATRPAQLERSVSIPAGRRAMLRVFAAAHDQGDWELRVVAEDQELLRRVIDHSEPRWKTVEVDLSRFAGRAVVVRLENRANDWAWEFGYWADLRVDLEPLSAAR